MAYGDSTQFQPPTQTQKAEAQARLQQARQENQAVQQQRQQAPSSIKTGSPEDIAVRAEAAKAEQQRMVEEHVSQIGSSTGRFAQAREQALKSGSFSYGSFGTPVPNSFVTSQGQRIERPVLPMTQGGNARPEIIMRTAVTPTPTPTSPPSTDLFRTTMQSGPSPVIRISQAQLNRTNAIRASQGLPPLEQVTTVQVVTPTQGPETGMTTLFGKTFKTFTPTSPQQSGEVSSFLKVPFAGQKAQGGQVPSTSLADVFSFVPIGSLEKGAVSVGKDITGFFTRAFSKEAPTITSEAVKVGTSDIGLNVPKYTEKFKTEKNIQSMIEQKMKSPPPEMARQGKEATPTPDITVSLGVGPGKLISEGKGSTGILEGIGRPPSTPPEKTVSAGKGLKQIIKEKQVTKTVQRQKPEFEQKQLSKQEQFLKDQEKAKLEQTTKTEEQLKLKQEESLIEKTGLRYIRTTRETGKQTQVPPIPIIKPRQTTEQKPKPQPVLVPPITIQTPTQKQELGGIFIPTTPTITTPVFVPLLPPKTPPSTPPSPPPKTPPTDQTTTDKKRPPDLASLGVGAGGGLVGKVSKSGFRREFVGNVPEASIIGTYKRSELSYSERTIAKSGLEQYKQSTGKFVQRKSNRIL